MPSKRSGSTSEEPLRLSRVLGLSTFQGSALASISQTPPSSDFLAFTGGASSTFRTNANTDSDLIFYAAGNVVVAYSTHDNEQKSFYATTGKPVSCMAVTGNGRYLAIGERGHLPSIVIWDLIKHQQVITLTGHKHGVGCLTFSPNGKYLVSAGFKQDKQLIFWDWDGDRKLSIQKLSNKVHSITFHSNGEYFITAGDRHLKWWYVTEVLDGEAVGIEGKPAGILEDMRTSIFMDICCASGAFDNDKVYCISQQGILCLFNKDRIVEKWVQLPSPTSYSLEYFPTSSTTIGDDIDGDAQPAMLFVGSSAGVIRVYLASNLEYLTDLPMPTPLDPEQDHHEERCSYGACYALRKVPATSVNPMPKLCAIYADRSMIIWDISDVFNAMPYRSFTAHRSCVWDIQLLQDVSKTAPLEGSSSSSSNKGSLPPATFVTCSADNSIRFWNLDAKARRSSRFKSPYSRDMLHAISFDPSSSGSNNKEREINDSKSIIASTATGLSLTHGHGANEFDFSKAVPDTEVPDRFTSSSSPRALAVHPFGHQIAIGDKSGALHIYDLKTMQNVLTIQAHSAEILSLSFSPPLVTYDNGKSWYLQSEGLPIVNEDESFDITSPSKPMVLLATAGRDRLIHVFDASTPSTDSPSGNLYSPIDTLDHHSSSVTIVRFTSDGKRLISCSGDKTMVFCTVNGPTITKLKTISTPLGTINGLAIETSNKFAITSGQDKRLTIWNIHTAKQMRTYKNVEITGSELYKSEVDPSGSYIVTSGFDKNITLLDFFSGEVLYQVKGHSEVVTGMKFSADGHHLITIGGEGCIMVWEVASFLVKAMKDRLLELYATAQRRNTRAAVRHAAGMTNTGASSSSMMSMSSLASSTSDGQSTVSVTSTSTLSTSANTTVGLTAPQASLTQLKQKIQRQSTEGGSAASETGDVSSSAMSTASSINGGIRKNRWQQNLEKDPAYEIFGKKIHAGLGLEQEGGNNRHKLTLELTAANLNISPEKTIRPPAVSSIAEESSVPSSETAASSSVAVSSSSAAANIAGFSKAAVNAENDDEVNQPSLSDEDEDDVFGGNGSNDDEEAYESDFDDVAPNPSESLAIENDDEAFAKAHRKIDTLEKSASDLESWLEEVLRNESKLDPSTNAVEESTASATDDAHNIQSVDSTDKSGVELLGRSLSSAFFRGIKNTPQKQKKGPMETGDDLLPPPPIMGEEISAEHVDAMLNERKLRESAATMAQMRERMRAMGMKDEVPAQTMPASLSRASSLRASASSVSSTTAPPPMDMLMPPPPPSREVEKVAKVSPVPNTSATIDSDMNMIGDDNSLFQTPTDSEDEGEKDVNVVKQTPLAAKSAEKGSNHNIPATTMLEIEDLRSKTKKYQQVLSDLERAKAEAAASYRELMQIRSSLSASTTSAVPLLDSAILSSTDTMGSGNIVFESMREADLLLDQFRRSLATVPPSISAVGGTTAIANTHNASMTFGSSLEQSVEVSNFLEKYSDKLVEIVGEKLLAKLNK